MMPKHRPIKLFFLPYAGGSATIYRSWRKYFSEGIEVYPLELAGRGTRFGEPFYQSITEAIDDLTKCAQLQLDGPYALFGHSMGALLAYEFACSLIEASISPPMHVFLSGRHPPHISAKQPIHLLSDHEFKAGIAAIGGTPREVLENEDLMNVFLPILRADYCITETYQRTRFNALNCGITFFFATDDPILLREDAEAWRSYTNKNFRLLEYQGGHFFLQQKAPEIAQVINEIIVIPEAPSTSRSDRELAR